MHPHRAKSHFVKYAGLVTSDYAINTISWCVLVFHCHHQWIYLKRFLPKSTLYGWLWGYGIWCHTSDPRCGAKFIYNKDQHANTYVSVWGRFPVGKYGHHILPSNLDLTSHSKTDIHQTFQNSLIEFLRTDLDGHLLPSNLDLTSHNTVGPHQTIRSPLMSSFAQISLLSLFAQV